MSYTPTTWQTGDTVTAALLNKMEQGIASAGGGGGILVAHTNIVDPSAITPDVEFSITLDKTFAELATEEFSAVELRMGMDDTVMQTMLVPLMNNVKMEGYESLLYYLSMPEAMGGGIVIAVEENGATATLISASSDAFILHGVLTSETTGTVTESVGDLRYAVQNHKQIVLEFTMDGEEIHLVLDTHSVYNDNGIYYATAATLFKADNMFVNVSVYPSNNNSVLVMSAEYFVPTPLT